MNTTQTKLLANRSWTQVAPEVLDLAKAAGFCVRVTKAHCGDLREVFATTAEVERMYDWLCP
jgi:hypothetical protein